MENTLVSVIIPTYKRSDCICNTIDSVLNQTYSNIEIIVVLCYNTIDLSYSVANYTKINILCRIV